MIQNKVKGWGGLSRYEKTRRNAVRNINRNRGFECPICNSYNRAGEYYCYNCGETPETLEYGGSRNSGGDDWLFSTVFYFWAVPISNLVYQFAKMEYPDLNVFLTLPCVIMLIPSTKGLIKSILYRYKSKKGKMDGTGHEKTSIFNILVRFWVLSNSGLAMYHIIKSFIIHSR